NYKVFDEKRYFSTGKGPCLFEVKGKKIALTICEDIWRTKAIRQAARRGAELVLNLNASPFHRNKFEERKELVSRHAKQFNLPIVYINQVGGQDELVFDGASMIISPTGECLVTFPSFKTHTESIEIELSGRRLVNEKNIINQKSRSELQDLYEALVLGTKDYIRKNGFSGAIIGSSGGIDSALTAVIAVDAIGSDQVKTFMMPFDYTAQMSIEDANKLAKNLGISHKVINIKDIFSSFEKSLEEVFLGKEKDKTEENLQSRSRGVLLMAISNKLGSLVLTTGNKSETAVGYSTLYGDTAGGFSVLKDVPKTWVYQLAKYCNTIKEVIPQRIIDRQPSAELAPNQKDSDSLPDYEILDKIIELYVEKDASIEDIVSKGLDKKTAEEVIRLIDKSEYKRRQAPPGVRITDRGFGKDRRYPITNRYSQ
ncbi:MAG: NAD+ synthase, partial [SAR86 cluster bacterium]|nr:NAD+ synthase [SAR86 cluster bacterium]